MRYGPWSGAIRCWRRAWTVGMTGLPLLSGCTSPGRPAPHMFDYGGTAVTWAERVPPTGVHQASYTAETPRADPAPPPSQSSPLAGAAELTEAAVVECVLARNPTVAQMAAAWQAAAARYPQVTSLEDPRVGGFVGPGSIGSPNVDFAYRIEVSQAVPYCGKRELRGQNALREANAAGAEVEDTRLQLIEAARSAFADYFLVGRATEVGEENLKLLGQFRENALSRFKAGQASQQDALQAEVAIARQRERLLTLDRQRKVAQARLNTLMHLPPDQPLPSPPKQLDTLPALSPAAELRAQAVDRRPDVAALRERAAADEAAVELALREYKPDFEVMAAYDAWWQSPEKALRPMLGVRANLPVRYLRRGGAVAEAQARLAQRRAELARVIDRVNFEVQEAYEQAAESEKVLALYKETTLPAARRNVELAMSDYTVGNVPFLNLIDAQRNLVELRDRQFEASAEALRRRAALDRATGALGLAATPPKADQTLPQPRRLPESPVPPPKSDAAPSGRGGTSTP
ncbi:MAG: TolC family protein [Gemmataceae bacterium]